MMVSFDTNRSSSARVVVPVLLGFVAVLAGTATPAIGQTDGVTFAKDIAPIFQASCQTCHREGSIAPMSLMTYEESRPWARAIRDKVASRSMPPWYIDRNIGVQDFKYDRSLSDDQIATIVAWVDAGAPRGNPSDMPAARQFQPRHVAYRRARLDRADSRAVRRSGRRGQLVG